MSNLPSQTSPSLCTDEDICIRCGADMLALTPPWQSMAQGADGVFAPNLPWILSSATVDFEANGVQPNQVVLLTAPKAQFPGTGAFLAIDSVSGNQITLRRLYKDLNVGQPPAPLAGLTGVNFAINTLDPQSEEASFQIKRKYGIDETIAYRSSSWVFDLQDLRLATVLTVLLDRYSSETRSDKGDFKLKLDRVRSQLDDVLARVQVRFGPTGSEQEATSVFSCKISR